MTPDLLTFNGAARRLIWMNLEAHNLKRNKQHGNYYKEDLLLCLAVRWPSNLPSWEIITESAHHCPRISNPNTGFSNCVQVLSCPCKYWGALWVNHYLQGVRSVKAASAAVVLSVNVTRHWEAEQAKKRTAASPHKDACPTVSQKVLVTNRQQPPSIIWGKHSRHHWVSQR